MKILLVNPMPAYGESQSAVVNIPFVSKKALMPPYGLAIIAGLTPRRHQVAIHDEVVHGPVDGLLAKEAFDVIGLGFLDHQAERAVALVQHIQERGIPGHVVLGGLGTAWLLLTTEYTDSTCGLPNNLDCKKLVIDVFGDGHTVGYCTRQTDEVVRLDNPRDIPMQCRSNNTTTTDNQGAATAGATTSAAGALHPPRSGWPDAGRLPVQPLTPPIKFPLLGSGQVQ